MLMNAGKVQKSGKIQEDEASSRFQGLKIRHSLAFVNPIFPLPVRNGFFHPPFICVTHNHLLAMQLPQPNIILGIDPGTVIMGYGIIQVAAQKLVLLEMGTLKLRSTLNSYEKLESIYEKVSALIETHRPGCFAIEAPFYGKNVQSMLKLGRAQGVAIAAAIRGGLPVSEYSPKKVKQSVTGNGNASKEQISRMLERLLQFSEKPHSFDATDAVAVAVCHHFQGMPGVPATPAGPKNWEQFIREHPEKLVGR